MIHVTTQHDLEQREIAIELAADFATLCGTIRDTQTNLNRGQRQALELAIGATRVLREQFASAAVEASA